MKKISAFVFALLTMLCTGCSFISGITEIMQPPKLNEEQDKIYNALISTVGQDISLKYPRSGKYRSAFVLYDIDNDSQDEALVFYENASSTASETGVKLNILDSSEEKWKSVCSYEFEATDVDMVDFINNKQTNKTAIVIGYVTGLSEKQAQLIEYEAENNISNKYETQYTSLNFSDVDSDDNNDMLVFYNNSVSEISTMTIVKNENGAFTESGMIEMEPSTTEIANVMKERSEDGTLLYIDTLKTNNMFATEIISVDNMTNLNYNKNTKNTDRILETQRTAGIYCADIDEDGKVEVPTAGVLGGYSNNDKQNQLTSTIWNTFNNNKLTAKYYSYYSLNDNYTFLYPERWKGQVTVKIDESTQETVFCKYTGDDINAMPELMRIKAVNAKARVSNEYQYVCSNENMDYYVKFADNTNEALILTLTEVTFNLHTF